MPRPTSHRARGPVVEPRPRHASSTYGRASQRARNTRRSQRSSRSAVRSTQLDLHRAIVQRNQRAAAKLQHHGVGGQHQPAAAGAATFPSARCWTRRRWRPAACSRRCAAASGPSLRAGPTGRRRTSSGRTAATRSALAAAGGGRHRGHQQAERQHRHHGQHDGDSEAAACRGSATLNADGGPRSAAARDAVTIMATSTASWAASSRRAPDRGRSTAGAARPCSR